jgi:filamentous hemagglutinin
MQVFAGLAEASAGGLATLSSGGLAAPIGWPVLVHGLDQFITGMSMAVTGKHRATLTEQLLQTTGMPSEWASFTNDMLTIGGMMGGSAIIRASSSFSAVNSINQKVMLNYGAENVNSGTALRAKLSGLQKAQGSAVRVRNLPDGRIRYYTLEVPATKQGFTRGASYVTEWNPNNGQVRSWMESYNHSGQVIRVHPKMLNGQTLESIHYPPIGCELGVK